MINNPTDLATELLKRQLIRFTPASNDDVTRYRKMHHERSAQLSKLPLESVSLHRRLSVPGNYKTKAYIPKRGSEGSHVQVAGANSLPLYTHRTEL
jgi:hypothetical protein